MNLWKAILATLVIFLAGAVSGAIGTRLLLQGQRRQPGLPPGPPAARGLPQRMDLLRRMSAKLDLSPEQRRRIDAVLQDSQQRVRDLWEPIAPQAQEEMRRVRKRIHGELTPKQREKFEKLLRQRPLYEPADSPGWRRRQGRPDGAAPPSRGPGSRPDAPAPAPGSSAPAQPTP